MKMQFFFGELNSWLLCRSAVRASTRSRPLSSRQARGGWQTAGEVTFDHLARKVIGHFALIESTFFLNIFLLSVQGLLGRDDPSEIETLREKRSPISLNLFGW